MTVITERDRIETENSLQEVRRSVGDALFQDLEARADQPGPHEVVNATIVAGARVLRQVTFDVYWHILYANETYEGGYVPYVRFSSIVPQFLSLGLSSITIDTHCRSCDFSDYQIKEQMEVLNRDYKSTNISWNMVNITRIHNPDWFVNAWPGSYVSPVCLQGYPCLSYGFVQARGRRDEKDVS